MFSMMHFFKIKKLRHERDQIHTKLEKLSVCVHACMWFILKVVQILDFILFVVTKTFQLTYSLGNLCRKETLIGRHY